MMMFGLTLVRMRETGEPVAVFEHVDDLITLGRMIEEVTDPSECQYADADIAFDFGLLFPEPTPDFSDSEEVAGDVMDSAELCWQGKSKILDVFVDDETEWCDFPFGLDCLSINAPLADRLSGDIF